MIKTENSMIRTYRMACTFDLIILAEKKRIIKSDWCQIRDFVGEYKDRSGVSIGVHYYEFSILNDVGWFRELMEKIGAKEVSCRHDYEIITKKVGFGSYQNLCSNCGKSLATFDSIDIQKVRRIKF